MDAFENIVASILQKQGYWTLTSVKVNITAEDKKAISRHTSPRWELDVVAYRGKDNSLLVVECKSFLDSKGVDPRVFDGRMPRDEKRYKLFCDDTLRTIVLNRLKDELVTAGFCRANPKMTLCLAAGNVCGDINGLKKLFRQRSWRLFAPEEIRQELESLAQSGYENSVAAVVTKLLLREPATKLASRRKLSADV